MKTLSELHAYMINCEACSLCETRTQVVLGNGNSNARVMFLGESPGEQEDAEGMPFVGKAGKKLDRMLAYTDLSRSNIYITNSVLCRPPNNRNPNQEELAACRWRLLKEIELIDPEIIVCLGRSAYEQLLGKQIKGAFSKHFSNSFQELKIEGKIYKVLPTFHPSYHLRSPNHAYKITLPHWTLLKNANNLYHTS